jgi:Trypsin-co-occurring domain 1
MGQKILKISYLLFIINIENQAIFITFNIEDSKITNCFSRSIANNQPATNLSILSSIAEVREMTFKFNLKISAAGGLSMIASSKTDADFAIEVKCKFPKPKQPS